MIKNKLILILTAVSFLTGNAMAQQNILKQRIEDIRQTYTTASALDVIMDIQVYENKNATKSIYHEQALVKRSGSNYYYRLSGLEMLMNEKYLIMVNEDQRIITCTRRDKKTESKIMRDPVSVNLDSLFAFYGTPQLIDKKNGIEHFIIKSDKETGILEIGLHLQIETGTINKLEYVYSEGQYVRIDFQKFDHRPSFVKGEFSEHRYFTEQKGVLKLSDLYSRFRLAIQ